MAHKSRRNIQTVEISKDTYERLKTRATAKHYNTKEYVNELLKMVLDKEELLQSIAPNLSVSGYHENTVTLVDSHKKEVYEVILTQWRLWCEKEKKSDCIHTWYVWAIPEFAHLNIAKPGKGIGKKKLVEILI